MFISQFNLYNYKCFEETHQLIFNEGINVIVGRNNVGKTALLEALRLKFTNSPNRLLDKENLPVTVEEKWAAFADRTFTRNYREQPKTAAIYDYVLRERQISSAQVKLRVSRKELWSILGSLGNNFCVALPDKETLYDSNNDHMQTDDEHCQQFLTRIFSNEEFTFEYKLTFDDNAGTQTVIQETKIPSFGLYEQSRSEPRIAVCKIIGGELKVLNTQSDDNNRTLDFGWRIG